MSVNANIAVRRSTPSFAARLENFAANTALIDESGHSLDYSTLAARADEFAAGLGDTPRLLLIEAVNDFDAVVAYLGALRGGHAVILVAEGSSTRDRRIIDTYAPDAVFEHAGSERATLELLPHRHDLHPDLALLLSTSGSTGAAKLVRLAGTAVGANAASIVEYLDIGADDCAITTLPIHYSYGLSVLNSHLAAGASIVLTTRSVIEPEFWDLATRHGVTSLAGVPHSYELFDRAGIEERAPPSLRTMTQAGGRLPPETAARYGAWARARGIDFFVMYGQTEATARMAYLPPDRLADYPDCIGVPIPGGRLELRGDDGPIDTAETPGELVYQGANVMMGYASGPADLALGPEIEALATGDIAVRNAVGLYRIVGRKSRFAKPFGLRIDLDEIEAFLGQRGIAAMVAGTDDIIAIGVRGDVRGLDVVAELAARYQLPETLFDAAVLVDFPHLPSGKRDFQALLTGARVRQAAAIAARAGGSFAPVVAALLRRHSVSPDDSFVSLEGDSLSYVGIVTEIDRRLGYVPDGWEEMTIAEIDTLAAERRDDAKPGWWKWFDSEIVLRALAIMSVVLTHSQFRILGGGSDALMILAGFNLARFNFRRLTTQGGVRIVWTFVKRVVLPFYVLLVGYTLFNRFPGWPSFLLVSNFFGRFHTLLSPYWFVEALFHSMVIIAVLFALPVTRRLAAMHPLGFAWALLGTAVLVRATTFLTFHHGWLNNFSTETVFPLFALGWLAYFVRSLPMQLACCAMAVFLAAASSGLFGLDQLFTGWGYNVGLRRSTWIIATPLLLLFVPRLPLPRRIGQGLAAVAAISFTIYLIHMFPAHLLSRERDVPGPVTLVVALALGFAVDWLLRWLRGSSAWTRTIHPLSHRLRQIGWQA